VLNFSELPAAVRRNVPPLSVSGYSYAEEAEARMVVINDRMLREGDDAGGGVRVDRIGAEGVILIYKGYRFRPAH
jgi:general secretion pathway protein B